MNRTLVAAALAAMAAFALYACGTAGVVCNAPDVACSTNVCVDLQSSLSHCGACDNACSTGQSCSDGVCVCPAGSKACPPRGGAPDAGVDVCVNLSTDPLNCGACGVVCPSGQNCVGTPDAGPLCQ